MNGTAISGTDFGVAGNATPRTGTVSWIANDAAPKSFTIPILDDAISQGSLAFTITLAPATGSVVIGTPGTATVTIVDNESAPPSQVGFAAAKVFVSEASGPAVLTVARTGDPIPASVAYATAPGTALVTTDYTTTTGVLTWAAGDTSSRNITVPITNDTVPEPAKQFTVTLSAPSPGVGLAIGTATVLLLDDDEGFPPGGAIPAGWVIPAAATTGWHVSSDPGAFEGALQLRSDLVNDNETASIEVTGNFQAGTVTFRYKVSSELNFDFLRFYVDGVERAKFSGAVAAWTPFSFPITAGAHTFRWSYTKDANASVGADAAWIDAVTLPAVQ